jgi:hypothetical protein
VHRSRRSAVVFCFGLVHGLGFAGALSDLTGKHRVPFTELVGFNLGVEFGQAVVLTSAMAAFALVDHFFPKQRSTVARVCSMLIAGVGILWFIERVARL